MLFYELKIQGKTKFDLPWLNLLQCGIPSKNKEAESRNMHDTTETEVLAFSLLNTETRFSATVNHQL